METAALETRLLALKPLWFERGTRFYALTWQPTLLDRGAVIRIFGRKGVWQRTLITPCPSPDQALALLRHHARRRLRHGYRLLTGGDHAL